MTRGYKPVVEAVNLAYTYPDGTVGLEDASMDVAEGERVVVLGPNGSGKTTLLLLLDGLVQPRKGVVRVFGEELSARNADRLRRRMALVFQDPDDQLFCPTVREDIAFGPVQLGLPEEEVEDRVSWAAGLLGVEHLLDRPPFRLSGGEKKRAAIAAAMALRPSILMLDEPTSSMDAESCESLASTLLSMNRSLGTTIVFATQDLWLAYEVAEKIVLLDKNKRVAAQGAADEILADRRLLRHAGFRPLTAHL